MPDARGGGRLGVPLVRLDGTALALKSGNFGGEDFFAEALAMMEADQ